MLCTIGMCVGAWSSAVAQLPSPWAVLTGTVRDEAGAPIPSVAISTRGVVRTARTDSAGRFRMSGVTAGVGTFDVRRIGFEPAEFTATLKAGDTLNLEISLTTNAAVLDGVTTTAESRVRRQLSAFFTRRESGLGGHFLLRADIEAQHALRLTDALRRVSGVQVLPAGNGRYTVLMARTSPGGPHDCPVQIWLDGIRAPGLDVDDVPPGDVEGIEIYNGAATLPPQFNDRRGTPACGTIAIWTRVPGT